MNNTQTINKITEIAKKLKAIDDIQRLDETILSKDIAKKKTNLEAEMIDLLPKAVKIVTEAERGAKLAKSNTQRASQLADFERELKDKEKANLETLKNLRDNKVELLTDIKKLTEENETLKASGDTYAIKRRQEIIVSKDRIIDKIRIELAEAKEDRDLNHARLQRSTDLLEEKTDTLKIAKKDISSLKSKLERRETKIKELSEFQDKGDQALHDKIKTLETDHEALQKRANALSTRVSYRKRKIDTLNLEIAKLKSDLEEANHLIAGGVEISEQRLKMLIKEYVEDIDNDLATRTIDDIIRHFVQFRLDCVQVHESMKDAQEARIKKLKSLKSFDMKEAHEQSNGDHKETQTTTKDVAEFKLENMSGR